MVAPRKNLFDSIEYLIVRITLLLLALIGALKLILLELKIFSFSLIFLKGCIVG